MKQKITSTKIFLLAVLFTIISLTALIQAGTQAQAAKKAPSLPFATKINMGYAEDENDQINKNIVFISFELKNSFSNIFGDDIVRVNGQQLDEYFPGTNSYYYEESSNGFKRQHFMIETCTFKNQCIKRIKYFRHK